MDTDNTHNTLSNVKRLNITLAYDDYTFISSLIDKKKYVNKSEFIREAVRDLRTRWEKTGTQKSIN